MSKERLDQLLVSRGMADSRAQAQRLVMAGEVRVQGEVVLKPATRFESNVQIEIERGPTYVSRGGEKLEAALEAFQVRLSTSGSQFKPDTFGTVQRQSQLVGCVCADVGASTGGFTDCLLRHGAARVYAIDVGKGILHWRLRSDQRVVVMEGTNARYLESLPERVSLVTIDASFISLKLLLPVVKGWLTQPADGQDRQIQGGLVPVLSGQVVALIKPQFEAGRQHSRRGQGVIRDAQIHQQVLEEVLHYAQNLGYSVRGLIRSPLVGPKGNIEFLAHLSYPKMDVLALDELIANLFLPATDPG